MFWPVDISFLTPSYVSKRMSFIIKKIVTYAIDMNCSYTSHSVCLLIV